MLSFNSGEDKKATGSSIYRRMSKKTLLRRLTFQAKDLPDGPPPILTEYGETAPRAVKSLLKSLELYTSHKSPEQLTEIGNRVGTVWNSVFNVENEAAPQKKYELAEEILLRPQIMVLLLVVFRFVQLDVKRKIRDLYMFIITWCSNDSRESCVPRSRAKSKFPPKVRDLLFHCRISIMEIINEGYDTPNSVGFYNDIIREFVKDDVCLTSIFEDYGCDENQDVSRTHGCVWSAFERIAQTDRNGCLRQFDVVSACFETLQIIFSANHEVVHTFITRNLTRFMQSIQKLIASSNFYVQTMSLQLLFNLFDTQQHFEIRSLWMKEPAFIRLVVLALQSKNKTVQTEAVRLFELFLENPNNSFEVHEFISRNSAALVTYCFDSAPVHEYRGNRIEQEDARFARIAHKLMNWNLQRPLSQEEQKKFDEAERLQYKMREEQTVNTSYQDSIYGRPTVYHEFNLKLPRLQPLLREPIRFGYPPRS